MKALLSTGLSTPTPDAQSMPDIPKDPVSAPFDQMTLDGLEKGARVVVGMSGGVDSSVVAALLKHSGYDVVGITLQLYDQGSSSSRKGACCAGQDIHDARRVADQIGIPHYVLDYEARFREAVIEPFAASYMAGKTPIPCVACNQSVKFHDLLDTARELGARAMATGHYGELRHTQQGPELYRAADPDRDQSYFLFATTREQLSFLRFPLGGLAKAQVRQLAAHFDLPVADKPDSQDICFVPTGRYGDVIARLHPGAASPGEIVHVDGRLLGMHKGIIHYTVGQRRGLGVAEGEALYVVRLNAATRQVVVGPRDALLTRRLDLDNVNWLGETPIRGETTEHPIHVRVRSTQAPQPAIVQMSERKSVVLLQDGEFGVAAGQACVFYTDGSPRARVLGGGFIVETDLDPAQISLATAFRKSVTSEIVHAPQTAQMITPGT
jgi:tRNA-uridine 2-sulfurtransferase